MKGNEEMDLENEDKLTKEYLKGFFTGLSIAVVFIVSFVIIMHFRINSIVNNMYGNKELKASAASFDSKEFDEKLNKVKKCIATYYLNETDESVLVDGAFKGIMQALDDPYSVYYTADEYESVTKSTDGEYDGIGVVITEDDDGNIVVKGVYDDTPAKKAGILENDILLKVNDEDFSGKTSSDIVAYIKSIEEGEFTVTLRRGKDVMDVSVYKETIEKPTVESEMLEGNIGYIKLSEFDGVSTNQFSAALNELKESGMRSLIIDLRNNPGGRLDVVCELLDLFVEKDKTLVYTKDKNGDGEKHYAKYDATVKDIPICVLVNENSASASEVFTGVMKDYGVGTIIGKKTFGKGIVQQIMDLHDGSAIKLTVSKYYLPNDENIHGEGISPDIEVADDENTADIDEQLDKAIEYITGR